MKKYYTNDFPTVESQEAFEKQVFKSFKPTEVKEDSKWPHPLSNKIASIGILDRFVVVGKTGADCSIFMYGAESENEMILITALDGFYEAVKLLLK